MQNRRNFLKQASLLLAGGLVAPQLLSSCAEKSKKHIGLQLYSLRDLVKDEGIQKVLETASKIGYTSIILSLMRQRWKSVRIVWSFRKG